MKTINLSLCLLTVIFFPAALMGAEQQNDKKRQDTADAQTRVVESVSNDKDKKLTAGKIMIKKASVPPEVKGLKN